MLTEPQNTAASVLVNYLLKADEQQGRRLLPLLSKAGARGLQQFGTAAIVPDAAGQPDKGTILLDLTATSLAHAISEFDAVRTRIEHGLTRASTLRLWSAILTTVLSSSTLASVQAAPRGIWPPVLGSLSILASILVLVAGRLEGGDTKVVQQYAEVVGKRAEAGALLDRLRAYQRAPGLFDDLDARLKQGEELIVYLQSAKDRWKIA